MSQNMIALSFLGPCVVAAWWQPYMQCAMNISLGMLKYPR